MRSILEEFACGNISPEPRFFKRNSEYGQTMEKLVNYEEKLLSTLNSSEKELLHEITSTQADISRLSSIDKFIYGYRLGVLMTTEVFMGKENLMAESESC